MDKKPKNGFWSLELFQILFFNLIPLLGVVFADWTIMPVILLFWLQQVMDTFTWGTRLYYAQKPYDFTVPIPGITVNNRTWGASDFENKKKALSTMIGWRLFMNAIYYIFLITIIPMVMLDGQEGTSDIRMMINSFLILWQPNLDISIAIAFMGINSIVSLIKWFQSGGPQNTHPAECFKVFDKDAITLHLFILLGAGLVILLHKAGIKNQEMESYLVLFLVLMKSIGDVLIWSSARKKRIRT